MRLIAELQHYRDRHPDEAATVDRMIDFVRREPCCFDRATVEGHITGSAWVVNADGRHVLLTHHRKLNRWLQLGGHADGDADVLRVAQTEAVEESGIAEFSVVLDSIFDVDIHPIPARGADPEHLHYDVRYVLRAGTTEYVVSEESHDVAWVAVEAIHDYTTEPSMLRMAAKWKSMLDQ
ncbi:MAG: NUDIX hydrolase [Candidatus Kapabacteria bacterium]|nr:NUDIX hydrolase [Candidatus Kapabacteria bacterium]